MFYYSFIQLIARNCKKFWFINNTKEKLFYKRKFSYYMKFYKLGKLLWARATGSTVISQILDSFVVSYLAFSLGKELTGQTPASFDEVLNIASTGKYVCG